MSRSLLFKVLNFIWLNIKLPDRCTPGGPASKHVLRTGTLKIIVLVKGKAIALQLHLTKMEIIGRYKHGEGTLIGY
jgi:hypothetical protein